ncbi:pre-peptidase C-terminal domain-containing protein [Synechococcus phage S-CRM01]|uniref:pre-peptidase C-terminal domain-containing protein n=1 Tax=Synechococcus phage S-CRM01 TaxID=1026955 RepID=UPI000209E354|nr:pre-peptidase C-terminal domain-containing protein [Synechococcus phage S-CRM01]AEC52989.1 pre-peptidase C-terminal domain-containing protein [Synechococcus phage S-CRM01]
MLESRDNLTQSVNNLNVCRCRACSALSVESTDTNPTIAYALPSLDQSVSILPLVDTSNTFKLHSNPTATKTIFLDFDGHTISNSVWENGGNLRLGSFYSTLNSTTLSEIQRIWQRIAEDFAPFNINVTTQDPGTAALTKSGEGDDTWGIRVAFTSNRNLNTGNPIINAGGGGTAYYNSFNWSTDEVALVFNRGEYTAANTASHEIGHTLNLFHDGNPSTVYYPGDSRTGATGWATIMGAPWLGNDEALTQWDRGEYSGANNQQDDLAVITGNNGFGYRIDDHGNTFNTATHLTGTTFNRFGIIETNTDLDVFRFETGTGVVNINIDNSSRAYVKTSTGFTESYLASRGANLDIGVYLYSADGTLIQYYNPQETTNVSISRELTQGTYYLKLDGVGTQYYSDYGSLGQYLITGSVHQPIVIVDPPVDPPAEEPPIEEPPVDPPFITVPKEYFANSGAIEAKRNYSSSSPITINGGLENTYSSDNQYMEIREGLFFITGSRALSLDAYVWQFDNVINARNIEFEGRRTNNNNADNFIIQYSTDKVNWTNAMTVSSGVDRTLTHEFTDPITGTIYVKAFDTKQGKTDGRQVDSLFIDKLVINGDALIPQFSPFDISEELNISNQVFSPTPPTEYLLSTT